VRKNKHKSGLGSGENYQTGPTGCARFIETEEDEEYVQWVKDGKDLDLLENDIRDPMKSSKYRKDGPKGLH